MMSRRTNESEPVANLPREHGIDESQEAAYRIPRHLVTHGAGHGIRIELCGGFSSRCLYVTNVGGWMNELQLRFRSRPGFS